MILIIGYGNSLRQDDGAGLILAEIIEQVCTKQHIPVERLTVHQLIPELSLKIADKNIKVVIFADTRVTHSETTISTGVQITPINTNNISPSVGHHLSPATLLTYAQLLYNKQPPAWVATVPGINFDHGEGFSSLTTKALTEAKTPITNWLNNIASQAATPSSII